MNILIISDHVVLGGATTFMNGLISQLLKNNNTQIYFAYFQDQDQVVSQTILKSSKIHYYPISIRNPNSIKSIFKRTISLKLVLSNLKSVKFNLIFTDLIYPTFAYIIINKIFNYFPSLSLVHHIHGSFSEEFKSQIPTSEQTIFTNKIKLKILFFIEHFVLTNCHQIFVNSIYSQKLTEKLHDQLSNIIINKPGIDPSLPKNIRAISKRQSRNKLGLNYHQKYILITSRIEPRKGVQEFINHLPHPNKIPANYTFIICTQFSHNPTLYSFFYNLNQTRLGPKIFMINSPSRAKIALLYKAVDVTIMPSISLETFGFTTLESYYYQTPVVAFNVAANPELIPGNFLVNYKSTNDFRKLYKKAHEVISTSPKINFNQLNFSWNNYVKQLLCV